MRLLSSSHWTRCVKSCVAFAVLMTVGIWKMAWPICTSSRLVVYNQFAREKSGRRTMAV